MNFPPRFKWTDPDQSAIANSNDKRGMILHDATEADPNGGQTGIQDKPETARGAQPHPAYQSSALEFSLPDREEAIGYDLFARSDARLVSNCRGGSFGDYCGRPPRRLTHFQAAPDWQKLGRFCLV